MGVFANIVEKELVNIQEEFNSDHKNELKPLIIDYSCKSCFEFLESKSNLDSKSTYVICTTTLFNIQKVDCKDEIINLHRINDIRYINKFFEGINKKLPFKGKFICCVETFKARKNRKKIGRIPLIGFIYFSFEFIFMRVFPKVKFLQNFYFTITRGKNRLLSKAETLGRLVSCGFQIEEYKEINGMLYIVCVKVKDPNYDMNPSYGPVYKMPRVGKAGKEIKVYKLRTMHPYSEYLQDYMFQNFGSKNGDKVVDDFRVSKFGSILRKFWLDELPMILNLIKGDIKLVGVRPLSKSKFKMYPKFAQKERIKFKPGLVPPFYADLPKNFDELVKSEISYIESYSKNPIKTDLVYFIKAFNNIIFKGARSK